MPDPKGEPFVISGQKIEMKPQGISSVEHQPKPEPTAEERLAATRSALQETEQHIDQARQLIEGTAKQLTHVREALGLPPLESNPPSIALGKARLDTLTLRRAELALKEQALTSSESGIEVETGPETKELIPEYPGLIIKEKGILGSGPSELNRPLLQAGQREIGSGEELVEMKETPSMGRAAFIERLVTIDGVDYNFLQWKGVCSNGLNEEMEENAKKYGGQLDYPLGDKGISPIFFMSVEGKRILRFRGASFYSNLLHEKRNAERFSAYGLRMPKLLGTIKFSREFCQANNLPVPANDNPDDATGENMQAFIEAHKEQIAPPLVEEMLKAPDMRYASVVLGQNVRAFRNVWRVDDVVKVMHEPETVEQINKLKIIIDSSKKILSKELGRELSTEEYLSEYAALLGQQAGTLIENRINQGALINHKQDITLAAEICDVDSAYQLNDGFFSSEKFFAKVDPEHKWTTEEDKAYIQKIVDRQVFLIAAHFKTVVDAASKVEGRAMNMEEITKKYVAAFIEKLSAEQKARLKQEFLKSPEMANVEAIAGADRLTKKNLEDSQELFDLISSKLLERL